MVKIAVHALDIKVTACWHILSFHNPLGYKSAPHAATSINLGASFSILEMLLDGINLISFGGSIIGILLVLFHEGIDSIYIRM